MRGSRMIKAATAILTIGYCSLLVYLGGAPFNFQVYRPRTEQVTNLPLESVTKATSVVNVNKTSVVDSAQNRNITLDDVFITVKTSRIYQSSRLPIILKTWFQLAKNQTWFFTDTDSEVYQKQTNGHMVNTNCPPTHELRDLCCKTAMEYDHFMESGKKWLCHFDDDNYVNVPRLLAVLRGYNYQEDWYLGRTAVYEQIKFKNRAFLAPHLMFSFWFATGGAGFCISRSLALKMSPVASDGNFISVCERIRLPDDVTMGFIIESLVKSKLTVIPEFHSHLEQMKLISSTTFKDQISFSYSRNKKEWNVVDVPGFNTRYDPTRFLSLHCFLFPHFEYCPRK